MRIVYFIVLLFCAGVLPWWLILLLFAWYAFAYRGYELIALGVLLDAYFGYAFPWHVVYTLAAGGIVLCAEVLKPRIALYTTDSI